MTRSLVSIVAPLALAGCLPIGLPPLEVAGGGGMLLPSSKPAVTESKVDAQIRPLAMVGSLHDRRVDVGAGIHLEHASGLTRTGPSLEGRGFLLTERVGDRGLARLGAGLEGRVLFDDVTRKIGPAGALHLTGEFAGFADGDCGSSTGQKSVVFGCYYGEPAIGTILESSYGVFGGVPAWTFTASLTLRIPAMVGILFFIPE